MPTSLRVSTKKRFGDGTMFLLFLWSRSIPWMHSGNGGANRFKITKLNLWDSERPKIGKLMAGCVPRWCGPKFKKNVCFMHRNSESNCGSQQIHTQIYVKKKSPLPDPQALQVHVRHLHSKVWRNPHISQPFDFDYDERVLGDLQEVRIKG